jgi:hypothetical protein
MEIKKNELLSSELSSCRDSNSSLKNLNAKIENVASSSMEHVSICNRCKYFDMMLAIIMLLLFLS